MKTSLSRFKDYQFTHIDASEELKTILDEEDVVSFVEKYDRVEMVHILKGKNISAYPDNLKKKGFVRQLSIWDQNLDTHLNEKNNSLTESLEKQLKSLGYSDEGEARRQYFKKMDELIAEETEKVRRELLPDLIQNYTDLYLSDFDEEFKKLKNGSEEAEQYLNKKLSDLKFKLEVKKFLSYAEFFEFTRVKMHKMLPSQFCRFLQEKDFKFHTHFQIIWLKLRASSQWEVLIQIRRDAELIKINNLLSKAQWEIPIETIVVNFDSQGTKKELVMAGLALQDVSPSDSNPSLAATKLFKDFSDLEWEMLMQSGTKHE